MLQLDKTAAAVDHLFAFTGRQFDAMTGLQNNLNRWYDPATGRWLTEDPIGLNATDVNLFRYVGNDAPGRVDPQGLMSLQAGREQLKGNLAKVIYGGFSAQAYREFNEGVKDGFIDGLMDWVRLAQFASNAQVYVVLNSPGVNNRLVNYFDERLLGGGIRNSRGAVNAYMGQKLYELQQLGLKLKQVPAVARQMIAVGDELLGAVGGIGGPANIAKGTLGFGRLATFTTGRSMQKSAVAMATRVVDRAGPALVSFGLYLTERVTPYQYGFVAGMILYEVTEEVVLSVAIPVVGGVVKGGVTLPKMAAKLRKLDWFPDADITKLLSKLDNAPSARPVLPKFVEGRKTSGVLRTAQGDVPLTSGWKGPSQAMPKGTPGMNIVTKPHVEGHAAAMMRQQGLQEATLYINRVPCAGKPGCDAMLRRMLPEGARLRVVGPDGFERVYAGLPD